MARSDWWMERGWRWTMVARWAAVVGPRSWSQPWTREVVAASRVAVGAAGTMQGSFGCASG
jgi:hypothetical protein